MRYKYSKEVVYNTFPWPVPSDIQMKKIEKTAQAILDARNMYSEYMFADLYNKDDEWMYPELFKAHHENDKAVKEAYGFDPLMTESQIVAELFK